MIKVLYEGHGEADVILGIRIKHESNGIEISQSHYIEKVLKKFNYSDCTPVSTPLDTCEKLMPNKGLAVSQLEYSRVIGCLMYTMSCTRPDIAFAVRKLSRYTSNTGTQHWQAIQRVLKYLKKTMDYRLVYSGYPSVLEGYNDASWISNTKDNSSATLAKAYSQMYNGKSRHLGVRHSMIRELIMNRAEAHVLQIIRRMCLEPARKKDEVAYFSMVKFFKKVLSMSMNKDEPLMYSNGLMGSILRTP
nr:zinc finger, CCHC-type [Tanacetum cinerariifolium]